MPDEPVEASANLRRSTIGSFALHASVKLSAVLVALIAVRAVSVREYGLLLAMQAFALVGVAIWDAGIAIRVTRDIAAGDPAPQALAGALWARVHLLPLPLLVSVILWASLLRDHGDGIVLALLSLVVMFAFGIGLLFIGVLQGQHRYLAASVPEVVGRTLSVAWVAYAAISDTDSLTMIWAGLAVCEVVTSIGLAWGLRRELAVGLRRTLPWRSTRRLVVLAFPYAAASVFIMLYNKFDVNMVRFGAGPLVAGLYGPASRIQDVFGLVPQVLITAAVPVAAAHAASKQELMRLDRRMILMGLAVAIPAAAVVVLGAEILVEVVLGSRYDDTVPAVRILALSLPFAAISSTRVAILVAVDRGRATTAIYACAFAVAAVSQVALSSRYGVAGAAWGALAREPALLVGSHLALRRVHRDLDR